MDAEFDKYLGEYIPHLSTPLCPVNELLEKDKAFCWEQPQITALNQVKKTAIAYFNLTKPTINLDASNFGIVGVLL